MSLKLWEETLELDQIHDSIPNTDEAEADEEPEDPSKFSNEGGEGVDELLLLHTCVVRMGIEGEYEGISLEICVSLLSKETVFSVEARLLAAHKVHNGFKLSILKTRIILVIQPFKKMF